MGTIGEVVAEEDVGVVVEPHDEVRSLPEAGALVGDDVGDDVKGVARDAVAAADGAEVMTGVVTAPTGQLPVAKVAGRLRRRTTGRGRGKATGRDAVSVRGRAAVRATGHAASGRTRSVKKAEVPTAPAVRPAAPAAEIAQDTVAEAEASMAPAAQPAPARADTALQTGAKVEVSMPPALFPAAAAAETAEENATEASATARDLQPASAEILFHVTPTTTSLLLESKAISITPLAVFALKMMELFRHMFIVNAFFLVCGWLVFKSVVVTSDRLIYGTPVGEWARDPSKRGQQVALSAVSIFTFLTLVFLAVVLTRLVKATDKIPEDTRGSLLFAISCLPIFGYIAFAVYLVEAMTGVVVTETESGRHILNAGFAVMLAVASAASLTFAEQCLDSDYADVLGYSVAWGVASSMKMFIQALFEPVWNMLLFQIPYVAVMSLLIPLIQAYGARRKVRSNRDTVDALLGTSVFSRALDLLIIGSSPIVVGYAWKSMFDCIFQAWMRESALGQLKTSLCVSTLVFHMAVLSAIRGKHLPKLVLDACRLASAYICSWTWVDFAAALAAEWVTDMLMLWVSCCSIMLTFLAFSFLADLLLKRLEAHLHWSPNEDGGGVASEA